MNVYKVINKGDMDYDYYHEAVVVAESKEAARLVHPTPTAVWNADLEEWNYVNAEGEVLDAMTYIANSEWPSPDEISVIFVSTFDGNKEDFKFFPVICSSFIGS